MPLTSEKAEKALGSLDGVRLTHEQASKILGVTRVRVTQMVSSGELTDLRRGAVEQFKVEHQTSRQRKKAEREAFKEKLREQRETERQELLGAINRVDRHLMMLATALAGDRIADTILR